MGWDTEVIIIAEKITSKKLAQELGKEIFDRDSNAYGNESFYIIQEQESFSIYYNYERRKYLPYWVIQEISKNFPELEFTLLGSCPDFLGGSAGIIRIKEGEILDSYGVGSTDKLLREEVLSEPIAKKELIYYWFKFNGEEEKLRTTYLNDFPKVWCQEDYTDNIIPIPDTELLKELVVTNIIPTTEIWLIQALLEL